MHLTLLRDAALGAVDPGHLLRAALRREPAGLRLPGRSLGLGPSSRLVIVAIGKASPGMAEAAAEVCQGLYDGGLIIAPSLPASLPRGFRGLAGGHPIPNANSLKAGAAIAELVQGLRSGDFLLALISGGGSALAELPAPGADLEDLRRLQQGLLLAGADIRSLNQVRACLSQLKRGGLARLAQPAQTLGLILSDVVGDPLEDIASGPTVPVRPAPQEARSILQRFQLWQTLPEGLRAVLGGGAGEGGPVHPSPINLLIGSNATAARAAASAATALGFQGRITTLELTGPTAEAGEWVAARLRRVRECGEPVSAPAALIFGGETTVAVRGPGTGGRNQEVALVAATALQGVPGIALMTLATDGVDGNSDAAGAIVTGSTCSAAQALGYSVASALRENDSHTLLHQLNACLHTGPTGTNVGDLCLGLVYTSEALPRKV